MTIQSEYDALRAAGDIVADPEQQAIVAELAKLQQRLAKANSQRAGLRRWLPGKPPQPAVRGIYLWGGVGRGKTFLMDLFFQTLPIKTKRRIHFHRMMSEVHKRLKEFENTEDPLDKVAADIAAKTSALCFDEFFVSDIGDAMILGRLLESFFRRGVTLVATSNSPPRELYRDGLQRARFVPAIEALEANTDVIELPGGTDYRLRLFEEAGTYLVPADDEADRKLWHYFEEIASGELRERHLLDINGRPVQSHYCAKGVVWFEFDAICDGPRSAEDYIEIARWYPTVIVSRVPRFDEQSENPARRFIALVDEFYDRKVKLVLSAAVEASSLYAGKRLEFEFQRTTSRLIEMQTRDYLHAEHLA